MLRRTPVPPQRPAARGSVLVMVLVMIAVTALMLSRFIERTTTELVVEGRVVESTRLRIEAQSALEAVLAVLADYREIDGALRAPAQGWVNALEESGFVPAEGTVVEVEFIDESGKLSLPEMDEVNLRSVAAELGLGPTDAARLTDALLLWTRADCLPSRIEVDAEAYARAEPAHAPPRRPLQSWDELAAVAIARDYFYEENGDPTEFRDAFVRSVSRHAFDSTNLNAANPVALAAAGLDESQIAAIERHLGDGGNRAPGAPPYFRSMDEVRSLLGASTPVDGFGTEIRCLRIILTASEGPSALRLEAVVAPAGSEAGAAPEPPSDEDLPSGNLSYPFVLLEFAQTLEALNPPTL